MHNIYQDGIDRTKIDDERTGDDDGGGDGETNRAVYFGVITLHGVGRVIYSRTFYVHALCLASFQCNRRTTERREGIDISTTSNKTMCQGVLGHTDSHVSLSQK